MRSPEESPDPDRETAGSRLDRTWIVTIAVLALALFSLASNSCCLSSL